MNPTDLKGGELGVDISFNLILSTRELAIDSNPGQLSAADLDGNGGIGFGAS